MSNIFSSDAATFWTALAALAASLSALLAIWTSYLTLALLRSTGEPKVIVYVRHDEERRTILTLVIENIGRDIAHDLNFNISRPIPQRAFGIGKEHAKQDGTITDGPLITGIPSLGPGDSRVIDWGQYGGLSVALGGQPIRLTYSYRHGKRILTGEAQLEVESYLGTAAAEHAPVRVARAAEEMLKTMRDIAARWQADLDNRQ